MLCLILFVLVSACTELIDFSRRSHMMTVSAVISDNQTRAMLEQKSGSLDLIAKWKEQETINLIVIQDGNDYETISSPINNISNDGKKCSFTFGLPGAIDPDRPYDIFGLCFVDGGAIAEEGTAYAHCYMWRKPWNDDVGAPMWFHATGSKESLQATFKHLGTYELLHLKNETDLPITVAHDGFNCDIPWYQAFNKFWLNDDYDYKPFGEWDGEAYSPEQIIMPHSEGVFVSWYIPSGFKIDKAQLVVNINGKYGITSTNTLSSDVMLECGHAYHMYATWDGTELKFDKGGMDTPSTIKVEPTEIDFGQVPVGSSKTEYFTVSNVGGSNLTFSVINHGNEFNIPDAGTEFTLASGEERKFSVTFSSSQENHSSSSMVRILSDAENGTQYLKLKGQTYSSTSGTAILVEPMEIDFGIVPQGTTKESYFTVTNIGQDDLKFTINQPSAPFSITGADTEETLVSGQSKQFAAICNGSEITGSGVQSHVNIKSNATNVEWGFGIILKATRETQDNPPVAYLTCPDDNHPHAIDLGLPSGTLWACCNVGADKPEGYGGYYAWGETEEKSCYNWETYRYYDASNETIQEIGTDIAGTNYDVAHVKWGKYWAMPTLEQWLELNHCTTSWTIQDGIYGCRLTSPNGGIVFFPATGSRRNYIVEGEGTSVSLWTSEVFMLWDAQESFIFRNDKGVGASSAYRYWGCPIRPVVIQ